MTRHCIVDHGGGYRRRAGADGKRPDARRWYRGGGRVLAAASIYRDRESLEAEVAMERDNR